MADLRSRFLEDYAGGFLNVSRQELSTTGEVLSQDGFVSEGTVYVEDGSGVKSGLLLGVGLAECVDPTTEQGLVNVRFADRTYAAIRDLKIFTTAISSAQYALADAVGKSTTNLEQAVQLLEDNVSALDENVREALTLNQQNIDTILIEQNRLSEKANNIENDLNSLEQRVDTIEKGRISIVPVSVLDTATNQIYYSGTIEINSGVVIGNSSSFFTEFEVGDVFMATTSGGIDTEFIVSSFDSITPQTKMTVLPSNVIIPPNSRYKRIESRQVKLKLNELIGVLKQLKIIS